MPGWTGTGLRTGDGYRRVGGRGDRPPDEGEYWSHPLTIATEKAGSCMKAVGIMKITGTTVTTTITYEH